MCMCVCVCMYKITWISTQLVSKDNSEYSSVYNGQLLNHDTLTKREKIVLNILEPEFGI
jgi:hypothetical protein